MKDVPAEDQRAGWQISNRRIVRAAGSSWDHNLHNDPNLCVQIENVSPTSSPEPPVAFDSPPNLSWLILLHLSLKSDIRIFVLD